jgi:hypothetical protein
MGCAEKKNSENTRHYSRTGNSQGTTAGQGIHTALREGAESAWHYGRTAIQHGTTAGRGIHTALQQDVESTQHYGRMRNQHGRTGNQHGITAGRGMKTQFQSTVHKRIWERFEVSYETLLKIISSGIWRSVVGRVVPDLSKNRSAVVFRASSSADCLTLHTKAPTTVLKAGALLA